MTLLESNQFALLESTRLCLQERLDQAKTQEARNRLGQFATPSALACQIIHHSLEYFGASTAIRFLDPAFGTGSFGSALLRSVERKRIVSAIGYEVDPHYALAAQQLWAETQLELRLEDFTLAQPPLGEAQKANLLICNPPYVRHHHLSQSQKQHLQSLVKGTTGITLSGLAGLYCYFLLSAHDWLADGGVACWLIPSEFMDVNYGQQVKHYLLNNVRLLRIHRFDAVERQFDDALVSSAVVWFKKERPQPAETLELTFGGSLEQPTRQQTIVRQDLSAKSKWNRSATHVALPTFPYGQVESNLQLKLSDLFEIKRGIATGANHFFVLDAQQIEQHQLPPAFIKPILPSPRYLDADEIRADAVGNPLIAKQSFLLDCNLPEALIAQRYPTLWAYYQQGVAQGLSQRYLCQHRTPWYTQDQRPPAPILCTYMGRSEQPFRFILNHSQATAANVYLLLYPKPMIKTALQANPSLLYQLWQALGQTASASLIDEGRVYGGGLHKLEPKELGNVTLALGAEIVAQFQPCQTRQLALL